VERNIVHRVEPDARPRKPLGTSIVNLEAGATAPARYTRTFRLNDCTTPRSKQLPDAPEEGNGISADTDVSVEQQGGRPSAGCRNPVEYRTLYHGRSARRCDVNRLGGRIDSQRRNTSRGEGRYVTSGPASDVQDRPGDVAENHFLLCGRFT
jgi:hypothetical protein